MRARARPECCAHADCAESAKRTERPQAQEGAAAKRRNRPPTQMPSAQKPATSYRCMASGWLRPNRRRGQDISRPAFSAARCPPATKTQRIRPGADGASAEPRHTHTCLCVCVSLQNAHVCVAPRCSMRPWPVRRATLLVGSPEPPHQTLRDGALECAPMALGRGARHIQCETTSAAAKRYVGLPRPVAHHEKPQGRGHRDGRLKIAGGGAGSRPPPWRKCCLATTCNCCGSPPSRRGPQSSRHMSGRGL